MTHEERLALLNTWYERGTAWQSAHDDFCGLLGIEDLEKCPILLAGWRIHEEYTKSVATRVGDKGGWLNWWWYDAERGQKGFEAKASNWEKLRPIRTISDLCVLIEDEKEQPCE